MSVVNKQKAACSGCNACAEACPKHCIEMTFDRKGFLYPKVNTVACINCDICEKVCPFEKGNIELNTPLTAYAACNKDRGEYLVSSSGGAAHVFSTFIIKHGGVVYGCTSEGMHIRHIRVKSLLELPKLQGSKYVQSDVRGLFHQVKVDLKTGKSVLFIGTPCQIAGLKNYIKNIPENLYLVDLICHGVPSQQMLHEHIKHVLKNRSAKQLSFRKGPIFCIEILSKNGTVYSAEPHKDMYFRAFLNGISYRSSCYQCPFAQQKRVGDITVGDFWGINNFDSFPEDFRHGISCILVSTEKGKNLLDNTVAGFDIEQHPVAEVISGNDQLRHPVRESWRAHFFRELYPTLSIDQAVAIVVADKKFKALLRIIKRKFIG